MNAAMTLFVGGLVWFIKPQCKIATDIGGLTLENILLPRAAVPLRPGRDRALARHRQAGCDGNRRREAVAAWIAACGARYECRIFAIITRA